jgi:kinesin family protein C1
MGHVNSDVLSLQEEIQSLQNQLNELQRNAEAVEHDHQRIVDDLVQNRLDMEERLKNANDKLKLEKEQRTETSNELQKSNESLVAQQKQLNDALEEAMIQLDHAETEKRAVEQKLKQALQQIETIQKSLSLTNAETSQMIQNLTEQVNTERQLREKAEQLQNDLDATVRSQKSEILSLQQQVQLTIQERDVARNNMDGYNEREQKLYDQLQHYEHVRREMHSKLIQLMGNIRVFIRIRPRLPHEVNKNSDIDVTIPKKHRQSKPDDQRKGLTEGNHDEEEIFRFPSIYDRVGDDGSQKLPTTSTNVSHTDATKNIVEVTAPYKYRGGLSDRRQQWTFGFDRVFTPNHSQNDIWEATDPLIQCAVDGYHVTLFAYGQTGSGVRVCTNRYEFYFWTSNLTFFFNVVGFL